MMWSVGGILDVIRQRTSVAPDTTSSQDVHRSSEVPSLWRHTDRDRPERSQASNGIFAALTSALGFASQDHENVQDTPACTDSNDIPCQSNAGIPVKILYDSFDRLNRSYRRISRVRDEMLELRTQEQIEWAKCADMRRFFLESQQRFMEQAEDLLSSQGSTEQVVHLRQYCRQARADLNAMEIQAGKTRTLEERLSNMVFKLQETDGSFVESCRSLIRLLPSPAIPRRDSAMVHSSASSETSSASQAKSLDPILESYYDKAGNVGLIGEELANLDIEYEEARGVRMFLADRDDAPSISTDEFEGNYRTSRSHIEQRLSVALREAQEMRQRCIDEGLDPNGRNKAPSEGTDDVLLGRGSEDLDTTDQQSHRLQHGDSAGWRLVGPDVVFQGGPVFRDPDAPFVDDYGPESPRAPDHTQNVHVLRWASQVPSKVDAIDSDSEIPDLVLENTYDEGVSPYMAKAVPVLIPQVPPPFQSSTAQWRTQTVMSELASMPDFRKPIPRIYNETRLPRRPKSIGHLESEDEQSHAGWSLISVPRRKSDPIHLQTHHSFDSKRNERPPARWLRMWSLRLWTSTPDLPRALISGETN